MPSLTAWGHGSGAPAYRQVVQRPTGQCTCKSRKAGIADLIPGQVEEGALSQRPLPQSVGEGREAHIANLIVLQKEVLEGRQRPLPQRVC